MSSQIATIVDYTAAVAAGIQGITLPNATAVGVRTVYGAGQGVIADPLHAGQTVKAVPDKVTEPLTHTSDLPDAPAVTFITQQATVEFEWTVPMRLYVNRSRLSDARALLLPFYDAYEAAFVPERTLGGLCLLAYIKSFKPEADDDWVWLAMELSVTELVRY